MSLPIGLGAEGLPIGVQVIGRRFDDRRLLRVAALLDRVAAPAALPIARELAALTG